MNRFLGIAAILGIGALAAAGCKKEEAAPPKSLPPLPTEKAQAEAAKAAEAAARAPKPDKTPESAKSDAAKLDPKKVEHSSGIRFEIPDGWTRTPPKTGMRVAEAIPPRAEGVTADGSLVVTYFGGGAGGFEANLDRWAGQMTKSDGMEASREDAKIRELALSGSTKAKIAEFDGDFNDPGMTTGQALKFANAKLLVAAVTTADGAYYFKLVGPAKSIAAATPSFEALLKSIQFAQ